MSSCRRALQSILAWGSGRRAGSTLELLIHHGLAGAVAAGVGCPLSLRLLCQRLDEGSYGRDPAQVRWAWPSHSMRWQRCTSVPMHLLLSLATENFLGMSIPYVYACVCVWVCGGGQERERERELWVGGGGSGARRAVCAGTWL